MTEPPVANEPVPRNEEVEFPAGYGTDDVPVGSVEFITILEVVTDVTEGVRDGLTRL